MLKQVELMHAKVSRTHKRSFFLTTMCLFVCFINMMYKKKFFTAAFNLSKMKTIIKLLHRKPVQSLLTDAMCLYQGQYILLYLPRLRGE